MGFEEVGEAYLLTREKTTTAEPWPRALDMMLALAKLMSAAEGQPVTHALEVAVLAGALAQSLVGSQRERMLLMQTALLHDMGFFNALEALQPHEDPGVSGHARMLLLEKPATLPPGLHNHLVFPPDLVGLLHLDPQISRWVAYHHTFRDRSGLLPDVADVATPTLSMNLVSFCDGVVTAMGGDTNRQRRFEKAQGFLAALPPARVYPEIVDAWRGLITAPEDLKLLDHRMLSRHIRGLYPEAGTSPYLNGSEILALCRWVGLQADAREPGYTEAESVTTAELMVEMGLALDLPLHDLGQLALAGLLHDVGKVALPLNFLTAGRALIADDRERLGLHARLVEEIFAEVPGFQTVAHWIGAHHEYLNGSGYPYGRRRQEIPVGARLLALADSYVALTRPRPFRPMPYRPHDALEILKQQQGRIFDPSLLKLLESTIRRRG